MSDFKNIFDHAMDTLQSRLSDSTTGAVLTYAVDASTATLNVVFNEQVGFVDDRRRAVFMFDADDLTTPIQRGDYFVLDGETARWTAVDVRTDNSGGVEVRCDGYLERL